MLLERLKKNERSQARYAAFRPGFKPLGIPEVAELII
jgi:hypothetical protein